MKPSGRIQARLALAIVITALIPVLVAIWMGDKAVRETAARYFIPEIGTHLDRSLGLYQELARTLKARMREEASVIALSPRLRRAAAASDAAAAQTELEAQLAAHPSLVALRVVLPGGKLLASADRGRPLDPARENQLQVEKSLSEEDDDGAQLSLVFAADRARFDELAEMSEFIDSYKTMDKRSQADLQGYLWAFTVLLGITIALAIAVGTFLARGVAVRLGELASATERVGAGNLAIRVSEAGNDEITALARAFNRMLGEVEASRSRIEYLQRVSAWQEMARRLAHEIKNPLTPIQLGVQEIHRRYQGSDERFRDLLDTTLEIVEDEVGTLRRLVSEFSDFARLPQAHLQDADLVEFLGEQRRQVETPEGQHEGERSVIRLSAQRPHFSWRFPSGPAEVAIDRQMLRRVLLNLIQNAADALADAKVEEPRIEVSLTRQGDFFVVDVDDNGPGIPPALRELVFDPYVTTKHTGTGLGLAIVKKIAIEHGGSATADAGRLGGARLRLTLPARGTAAARELPLRAEHASRPTV
ncbi:MAG: HAMP domain-containing protein [Myxococcales bacterium]|nr:MAG: HAMP domain-containing protein [Myxococcales bacterium]